MGNSKIYYTLIFIKKDNKVLLGFKKRGFAANTWNGYGGKLLPNETMHQCTIRELFEESNLQVRETDLNYLGVTTYNEPKTSSERIVFIFTTDKISGTLKETEEMKPKWFNVNKIPYSEMLPDYKLWLPCVLKEEPLNAHFTYNNGKIIEFEIGNL